MGAYCIEAKHSTHNARGCAETTNERLLGCFAAKSISNYKGHSKTMHPVVQAWGRVTTSSQSNLAKAAPNPLPSPRRNREFGSPRLIEYASSPQNAPAQTGPRSVRPCLHCKVSHMKPHDRQTDTLTDGIIDRNSPPTVVSVRSKNSA